MDFWSRPGAEIFVVVVIVVIVIPPEPAETSFYLHKEFEISKSAWYGFAWSK